MDFGINFFPTDTTLQPVELARAVEERGFDSLWFAEHSHIPTSRATPAGGMPGARPLPEKYWRTHEQFTALAACAVVTSTIRLGSGISPDRAARPDLDGQASSDRRRAVQRAVAVRDRLRMERRGDGQPRHRLLAAQGVDPGEDADDEVALDRRRCLVRGRSDQPGALVGMAQAVQKPHPPIIMGAGAGPKTIAHMVEFCDGWIPLGRHEIGPKVGEVRRALEDAGRDSADVPMINYGSRTERRTHRDRWPRWASRRPCSLSSPIRPQQVIETLDEISEFVEGYR